MHSHLYYPSPLNYQELSSLTGCLHLLHCTHAKEAVFNSLLRCLSESFRMNSGRSVFPSCFCEFPNKNNSCSIFSPLSKIMSYTFTVSRCGVFAFSTGVRRTQRSSEKVVKTQLADAFFVYGEFVSTGCPSDVL